MRTRRGHIADREEVFCATTLDELGTRIWIIGPSNSGKSTLADAIGRVQSLEVIPLNRLHHLPHTDWVHDRQSSLRRFTILRSLATAGVVEGN